jgi:DNA-binding beta-propeller fold protein YncE
MSPHCLLAQPQLEIEFISSFGQRGTAPGEFNTPAGVAVDNNGHIYITDNTNHRIQICDYSGDCEAFGRPGNLPGEFQYPIGIDLDSFGRMVVSDGRNFRIQIRDLNGTWSTFGSFGEALGQFKLPGGVVVDDANFILVADENNGRVQKCSDQGVCTTLGKFGTPRAVALDSQGRIVVTDWDTNMVSVCTSEGACSSWGSTGMGAGQFRQPCEVFVDGQDRVFVTDRDNDRFQVCDLDGACTAFGQTGIGPGQFMRPVAITVDDQDRIIIGDRDNDRIQIFQAIYTQPPGPTFYTVGGTVSGLVGSGLVLQNNDGNDLPIAANGDFVFPEALPDGSAYVVSVLSQPVNPDQTCTVSNGSGTLAGTDVTDVFVNCLLDSGFPINVGLSDAWYNPATNGQGFLITVFPDIKQMFLAWFTFDTERPPEDVTAKLGESGHRWLTAQGPYDGDTANLTIFVTEGGIFDAALPVAETDPTGDGTLTLEFADCTEGLVNYEIASLGISGAIPIERITPDHVALCETLASP